MENNTDGPSIEKYDTIYNKLSLPNSCMMKKIIGDNLNTLNINNKNNINKLVNKFKTIDHLELAGVASDINTNKNRTRTTSISNNYHKRKNVMKNIKKFSLSNLKHTPVPRRRKNVMKNVMKEIRKRSKGGASNPTTNQDQKIQTITKKIREKRKEKYKKAIIDKGLGKVRSVDWKIGWALRKNK